VQPIAQPDEPRTQFVITDQVRGFAYVRCDRRRRVTPL
jgi:hypothetical protein